MPRIVTVIMFFNVFTTYGQVDLGTPVSLKAQEISLEELFRTLESEAGILIAYGSDNIPSELCISIDVDTTTLYEVIQLICLNANLSYQIIDNVIVFKHLAEQAPTVVISRERSGVAESVNPSTLNLPNENATRKFVDDPAPRLTFRPLALALKVEMPPQLTTLPTPAFARNDKDRKGFHHIDVALGFSYSVDFNDFRFTEPAIAFQKYRTERNQSFDLGAYVVLTPKIYVSLGAGYSTKDFSFEYNYLVLDPDDPFPIPDKTVVRLRYLELPLTFGFRLLSYRQYSVWLDAGANGSFPVHSDETTSYQNKPARSTDHFLISDTPVLYGGSAGFVFHRSITKGCGFFISPCFRYYSGTVNKTAIQSDFALYQVKGGIQFRW